MQCRIFCINNEKDGQELKQDVVPWLDIIVIVEHD